MLEVPSDEARKVKVSICVYLALTAAFSAAAYYFAFAAGSLSANHGLPALALMWSPGMAGLLTRLFFQGNLRGQGWGWGKTKYQLASYWIPLVYASAVYLPLWAAGYADFHSASFVRTASALRLTDRPPGVAVLVYFLLIATLGFVQSIIFAAGEELGWRGFLVPQLAKVVSFPRVALISGCIWALWHYPAIIGLDYHGKAPQLYSLVCFTVLVIGLGFLFAWMRLKSGSLWTGVFLHASHNIFIQGFFDVLTRSGRVPTYVSTEFGAGLALAAIVIAAIVCGKRRELTAIREVRAAEARAS